MNTPGLKNILLAAAVSVGLSAEAATPAKKIEVQRQKMASKLQTCLTAGFDNYSVTSWIKDENGSRSIRSAGWLTDGKKSCEHAATQPKEGCPKVQTYVGGGRIQYDSSKKQKQVEIFTDTNKPGSGAIKIFTDEVWSNDEKDSGDKIDHVVCYGREAIPASDQKVINKMGVPDCTSTVAQNEAQKEYDDFMAEATAQCDYKAEMNIDFGNKLREVLKRKK